jgi:hypothetical protein
MSLDISINKHQLYINTNTISDGREQFSRVASEVTEGNVK